MSYGPQVILSLGNLPVSGIEYKGFLTRVVFQVFKEDLSLDRAVEFCFKGLYKDFSLDGAVEDIFV